ncbi:uncharacterized protein [Mycetomoellerius zeteki]|uniref:uncharacterized protein n=1 Tax=Mycetomoellerius zeteki TaxID=64791 RepID=UPI00084E9D13|nr:PREDICTED: uncharacterized protein LOC108725294 [Trachymyrmex zeteki]
MELEKEYIYNNIIYKIVATKDVHNSLQNDPNFFTTYFAENMSSLEAICVSEEKVSVFTWTKQATKLFLQVYFERKEQFRDPKVQKKSLWTQICNIMSNEGYNVDEDTLDRKMRNLKKTYRTIKDNNKKSSTGRGRICWEYYDTFEEIFRNDATINHGPTLSSMQSTSINAKSIPSTSRVTNSVPSTSRVTNSVPFTSTDANSMPSTSIDENSMPSTSIDENSMSFISNEQIKFFETNDQIINPTQSKISSAVIGLSSSESQSPSTDKENKRSRMKTLSLMRKKQFDVENSRIEEIKRLKEAMDNSNTLQKESNSILKERNDLLKDILLEMKRKKTEKEK